MGNINFKTLSIQEFIESSQERDFMEFIKKEHEQVVAVKIPGTTKNFSKPENASKNQSKHSLCLDHSRVILKPPVQGIPSINEIASDYINANFVDGFEDPMKFICADNPMDNTAEEFWRMVWQENCPIIVALTRIGNSYKCCEYWANTKGGVKVFGRYVIKTLEIMKGEAAANRTRLLLTDAISNESSEIYHFSYSDFAIGAGGFTILAELYNLILQVNHKREELRKNKASGPIVIHGSIAVDWTGIFCTVDNALYQARKELTVSIPKTVLNIRKQRHRSIYYFLEYQMCYDVLNMALEHLNSYIEYPAFGRSDVSEIEAAAIEYFLGMSDSE